MTTPDEKYAMCICHVNEDTGLFEANVQCPLHYPPSQFPEHYNLP